MLVCLDLVSAAVALLLPFVAEIWQVYLRSRSWPNWPMTLARLMPPVSTSLRSAAGWSAVSCSVPGHRPAGLQRTGRGSFPAGHQRVGRRGLMGRVADQRLLLSVVRKVGCLRVRRLRP